MLGLVESNYLFMLNGIAFMLLLYATFWTPSFLKDYKSLIRWAYILLTAVTIVLFFVSWGIDGLSDTLGMFTKVIELLLLISLWTSRKE
jgi:hypothetical protein